VEQNKETDADVEELLDKLVKEDGRLYMARKQAKLSGVAEDGISERAVQIYTQKLSLE
jgi:hypothetical protein